MRDVLHQIVRAVVCAALILSVSEVAAQQRTDDTSANSVFLGCKAFVEDRVTVRLASVANFCAGVVHGLSATARYVSPPEWQSCAPADSDTRQLLRVVVKYIEAHPERMHEDRMVTRT